MHRGGSSRCRQKFTSRFRQIHRTAPCWNKPRLIVRCTKVCREKSAARPNFFGKANNQRLSSRAQSRDPAAKLKPNFIGVPATALGMTALKIRKAIESDVPQLLPLMRELAEFEDYADAFAITEDILREQGFRQSPPDFYCLVAEESGILTGLLVYYFVAFTYRAPANSRFSAGPVFAAGSSSNFA